MVKGLIGYSPVLIFFHLCDSADFVNYFAQRYVYAQIMCTWICMIKTFVGHENIGPVNILEMYRIKLQFNSNEIPKKEWKKI